MTVALQVPPLSSASSLNDGQLKLHQCCSSFSPSSANLKRFRVSALKEKTQEIKNPSSSSSSSSASAEDVTKKYGLEAGLWKVPNSSVFLFSLFLLNFVFRIIKYEWEIGIVLKDKERKARKS